MLIISVTYIEIKKVTGYFLRFHDFFIRNLVEILTKMSVSIKKTVFSFLIQCFFPSEVEL